MPRFCKPEIQKAVSKEFNEIARTEQFLIATV
jgi:hypothetical protein